MKKIKLSRILDSVALFVLIFAICFIWCRYIIKNLVLSFIISFLLSFLAVTLQNYLSNKKQKKLNIKKNKNNHISDCANTLLFNSFEENYNFFQNMLSEKYKIEIKNNYLLLSKDDNNIALFLLYDTKKITQDHILLCLKSVKNLPLTKIVILCNDYELNVSTIASNFKIKTLVLNSVQTYNEILSVFNCFPETSSQNKVDEKITFSFLLRNAINKRKAKTYFWGGLFLLLASLVIRYNIYYIIFATVMFGLCIVSLFADRFYKTNKTEIL